MMRFSCVRRLAFPLRYLDYLVAEFLDYDNDHRSHIERDWLPPIRTELDQIDAL